MRRSPILLTTLMLAAAPLSAWAQARPAAVVAAAPRMAATPLVVVREDPRVLRRAVDLPPTQPRGRAAIRLSAVEADEVPEVDLRPKDEWVDDQGLQLSGSKLAFKRRF